MKNTKKYDVISYIMPYPFLATMKCFRVETVCLLFDLYNLYKKLLITGSLQSALLPIYLHCPAFSSVLLSALKMHPSKQRKPAVFCFENESTAESEASVRHLPGSSLFCL